MHGLAVSSHILRGVRLRAAIALTAGLVASAACGDDVAPGDGTGTGAGGGGSSTSGDTSATTTGTGSVDPGGDFEELHPDAEPLPGQSECVVEIRRNIPIASAKHVELCSDVDYPTNPPSGGDHWPRWATFRTYDAPVPKEMLVHNLEHGAIVMLHDCADCGDAITSAFEDAQEAHGLDQKCITTGATARFIIAPDPDLEFPVAMAGWGATYNATCIDPPSIAAFVEAQYNKGTEDVCAAGVEPGAFPCP